MRCNWRRWLWGLIPLVAVGLIAAHFERGAIEQDLAQRAKRSLGERGAQWAEVSFEGRDANLRGHAVHDNQPLEAEAALRKLWGVREVDNNAVLPRKVEPFLWSARRRGNRLRLAGYVPDRATHRVIIGMASATLPGLEVIDRMRLARGAPPTDTWIAGLSFALKQLATLKRGEVRMEDLAMSISGEAEDAAAYRSLSAMLKGGLPKGITLASAQIAAPTVSPYTWSAQFGGGQLVLSGHVAGESARAELLAAAGTAPAGTKVLDRMEPAEGAPPGWVNVAAALVKELVRLQSGNAEMKDAMLNVGGIAADEAQAQAVRTALRSAVVAPFKFNDQIRVREPPKPEPKPAPEPASPLPAEQPPAKEAAPATPPHDGPKLAAPASPPPPEAQPAPVAPAPQPAPQPPAAPAPQAAPAEPKPAPAAPAPQAAAEPTAKTAPEPAAPAPKALAACAEDLAKIASASQIVFERGSSKLDPASHGPLDQLAAAAKACPGVRIDIEGHADIEGSAEHNERLALKRAQAVASYLIGVGADGRLMEAVGFGSSRPVAPNDSAENRAKNRRTEIIVRR
jgi:OOP family OmpA-OmpF porin